VLDDQKIPFSEMLLISDKKVKKENFASTGV
jgi:hypothetical protein